MYVDFLSYNFTEYFYSKSLLLFNFEKNFGLLWVFIAAHELSVVVAVSGSYSLVAVFRFLLAMASLVVEHGCRSCGLQYLRLMGSRE